MLLHRAFTETPDYETASRGFLGGGVPPLSSYQGLPSYEEAAEGRALPERSRSEPDIAGYYHPMNSIHSQLSSARLHGSFTPQHHPGSAPVTTAPSPPRNSLET